VTLRRSLTLSLALIAFSAYTAEGQVQSVLYAFPGGSTGGIPYASLATDKDGNLYGTALEYGNENCTFPYEGCGTIFELSPSGGAGKTWKYTVLYSFRGNDDGANPAGSLTLDRFGNLYGATIFGGVGENPGYCGSTGCGTIFELQRSASGWEEKVLYRFRGPDGASPLSVTVDNAGDVYGTTEFGGDLSCYYEGVGCGVVFELERPGKKGDPWNEAVLHAFSGPDGAVPLASVTLDQEGNVYGTANVGGIGDQIASGGVVFEVRRSGDSWTESTLYEFPQYLGNPGGPLVVDSQGNIYGTTIHGGNFGIGSVFELSKGLAQYNDDGSLITNTPPIWTETDIYDFDDTDGGNPMYSGVVFDTKGNLYGATHAGGTGSSCDAGCGTVFELTKNPSGYWEESELSSFAGGADGFYPFAGVIIGPDDSVYGMTPNGGDPNCMGAFAPGCGVIYRISR
jgi:hypothetical protein